MNRLLPWTCHVLVTLAMLFPVAVWLAASWPGEGIEDAPGVIGGLLADPDLLWRLWAWLVTALPSHALCRAAGSAEHDAGPWFFLRGGLHGALAACMLFAPLAGGETGSLPAPLLGLVAALAWTWSGARPETLSGGLSQALVTAASIAMTVAILLLDSHLARASAAPAPLVLALVFQLCRRPAPVLQADERLRLRKLWLDRGLLVSLVAPAACCVVWLALVPRLSFAAASVWGLALLVISKVSILLAGARNIRGELPGWLGRMCRIWGWLVLGGGAWMLIGMLTTGPSWLLMAVVLLLLPLAAFLAEVFSMLLSRTHPALLEHSSPGCEGLVEALGGTGTPRGCLPGPSGCSESVWGSRACRSASPTGMC